MSFVNPATIATGELVTAARWNQDVKDNVLFLADAPSCRATHNTTQSLTDNVETTVAFNTDTFDNAGMHDPVTNNGRITFTTAGVYVVTFGCEIAAAADYASYYSYIRKNGTTIISPGGTTPALIGSVGLWLVATTIDKFAANDYVEVRALQNNTTSAARNIASSPAPYFAAVMVSRG